MPVCVAKPYVHCPVRIGIRVLEQSETELYIKYLPHRTVNA